jgi:curved DNA-binding protein CbpA
LSFEKKLDAYGTLQVDPAAHEVVIRAAYHALARRYHPDGETPDARRMAELNYAYDLVRDDVRRRSYDQRRRELLANGNGRTQPMGPGTREQVAVPVGAHAAAGNGAAPGHASEFAGPFTRARDATTVDDSPRLDFGRYVGWSLRDLARHDPDYLRWLSRHSSGVRFRAEILRLLPEGAGAAAASWRDPVR